MKGSLKVAKKNFLSKACLNCGAALFLFAAAGNAYADSKPLDVNSNDWVPYDLYKDKSAVPADAPKPADKDSAATAATAPITPPELPKFAPVIAAPTRPLNMPPMPGMNKGYAINVQTTADGDPQPVAQASTGQQNQAPEPQFVKEQNWQKAWEAARKPGSPANSEGTDEKKPLDVRLSYLPSPNITPTEPEMKPGTHGRPAPGQEQVVQAPVEQPKKKTPQEAAACAAMDSYKKKQLDAIKSDRQTLKDLQTAIAQLGLQKQLNFMTNAEGSVSASASATDKMDMPSGAKN